MRELDDGGEQIIREAAASVESASWLVKELGRGSLLPRILTPWRSRTPVFAPFSGAGVSDEQFMYGVQGELRDAAAHPSERTWLFLLATAGSSLEEVVIPLVAVDLLAASRPDAALRLGEASDPERSRVRSPALATAAAAIAALDILVERSVERGLDDLQRRLTRSGTWAVRFVSLMLGIAGSLFGTILLQLPSNVTLWSIGVTGGVLAILLRDGLAAAARRSQR